MPWVDESGKPVDPEEIKAHFAPYPVTPPERALETGVRTIGKVLPRAGLQTGGAEAGAAIGGAIGGPIGAPVGAVVGAGLGNVAGSKLPEEAGGTPDESATSAFLWGAAPEAGAYGLAQGLQGRVLKRGAQSAYDHIVDALKKPPSAAEAAAGAAETLGRPALAPAKVMTGDRLTDATRQMSSAVLDSVTSQRRELGEPIGAAYTALKGNTTPLNEAEATDLSDAAAGIKDSLIAPTSSPVNAIFKKIQAWRPPPGNDDIPTEAKIERVRDPRTGEPTGDLIARHKLNINDIDWMRLNNFSDKQISRLLEASKAYEPPTLDQIRELRQRVNTQLRSAKGGDAHALALFQQALDQHLMPHLPPEINRQRELYRGFIQRFPWRDANKVGTMGTPTEISKYVFDGPPERTAEIVQGLTPEQAGTLREGFVDRMMSSIDPNMPPEEQVKALGKAMAPHIADGTATKILGDNAVNQLREIIYSPIHRARLAKVLDTPENQATFTKEWSKIAGSAKPQQLEAAEAGLEKVMQSLPPAEQARFTQPAVPGAQLPVLPATQESLAKGALPGPNRLLGYATRRTEFAAPYVAGRAVMGGGSGAAYGAATALAFGSIAVTSAGYRAIMENGGATGLARLYASHGGRTIARSAFEMLAGIGSAAIQQRPKEEEATGGEWKVEPPK